MEHKVHIEIPLENSGQADTVCKTLRPDPEVKPHELTKKLQVRDNVVVADFEAVSDRALRVGVNGFMESVREVLECLSTFWPEYAGK